MPTPALLTIGHLARRVGVARGSLLNYEALGLLQPQARSAAGYRLYGDDQVERVRWIRRYREAGLPLASIARLLASPAHGHGAAPGGDDPAALLESHLIALSAEIERLRRQQQDLARLLAERRALARVGSKVEWVALLSRAGFDDAAMRLWHATFEAEAPARHAAFLRALGLPAAEVAALRRRSQRASRSGNATP